MKFVRLQDEVIKTIQARQDSDFEHHARDILDHGQRLKKLEERESDNPTKKQTDRRDILKGLLVINGGRMFACDARKRIGLYVPALVFLDLSQRWVIYWRSESLLSISG
ncbi:hypothetical protein [Methanothrix soehngenii]|uniref:hypothetical protein n=1 Tax=Methanothrix soehngenii TaxID=2223 RepID=UPI00300C4EF9